MRLDVGVGNWKVKVWGLLIVGDWKGWRCCLFPSMRGLRVEGV